MKDFLVLLLRNATKRNSIKFSGHGPMFPLTNPEIAWNPLNAIMFVRWWTNRLYARLKKKKKKKKNISSLIKMKRIPKEISEINLTLTMHEMHVACEILVHHHAFLFFFFFFQLPYLHKMVCCLNSWEQIVKTIARLDAWLTELFFGRNTWLNTCTRKEILSK